MEELSYPPKQVLRRFGVAAARAGAHRVRAWQRQQPAQPAQSSGRARSERAATGTLLFDLLRPEEALDRNNVFDIDLLGRRVTDAIEWLDRRPSLAALPLGLFGASTGAAAALVAAAARPERVFAVVSRGGRPDLAGASLARVRAPTLLIVGGADAEVLALNRRALGH